MLERKNCLLLFSKVPQPGLVKTRLTTLKDGIFMPEGAALLYQAMLQDVVEICCEALDRLEKEAIRRFAAADPSDIAAVTGVHDAYELVVSTTPPENSAAMRQLFAESGPWSREIVVIADTGASFDEHYNDAFAQAWARGADAVFSIGCDMPALTCDDITRGFHALHEIDRRYPDGGGLVIAPDQEMGVSAVGWTRATSFSHSGVFYNPDGLTVLPAYIAKARERNLPVYYLPPIPDVDTMSDLAHSFTLVEALNYCALYDGNTPPHRTQQAMRDIGIGDVCVAPNALFDPREHIDTSSVGSAGFREV